MIKSLNTPAGQLVSGALLAIAATAAYLVGGQGTGEALIVGALVFGVMLLVVVARRRSNTFEVMSGIGDERTRHLYQRSMALSGSVMSFVLPGWWLVTVALGEPNITLSVLCAVFALVWPATVVVLSRRA